MKHLKPLLVLIIFLSVGQPIFAQDADIATKKSEKLFTDKDKNFLQLWYYDQVLKMQLDEDGRLDYLALLQYYTYKMTRLGLAKYEYTDAEQKERFDELGKKLHAEMKDLLSEKNYQIHLESFKEIEEAVYKKKNWKK